MGLFLPITYGFQVIDWVRPPRRPELSEDSFILRQLRMPRHMPGLSEVPQFAVAALYVRRSGVIDQACPNYAAVGEALPAASPLAVRKGCAFPSRENTSQPRQRRREGPCLPGGARKVKQGFWPERRSLSTQQPAEPCRELGGLANLDSPGHRPPSSIGDRRYNLWRYV